MANRIGNVTNPNGAGGFGDNPQNRNPGGWDKNESISYWYNKLGRMEEAEFLSFKPANINQKIALNRVLRAMKDDKESLAETKEIADRTEGKARERVDITTDGESLNKVRELTDEQLKERINERLRRQKLSD